MIDDFRKVSLGAGGKSRSKSTGAGKGYREEVAAFAEAVAGGGPAPISWQDMRATTLASILAVRSLREGVPFEVR